MNNIGSRLFAFFIWPFGAWLSALRKANQKSSYVVFFLFSLLLCWHMSPTEGTYYDDFVGILDRFKNTYFTTNDIVDQIRLFITRSDDAPKELYENVLTWFIKSYTDNYHFFFLLASIPIALCQLKSLSFITFDKRYNNMMLPSVKVIDMNKSFKENNSFFSKELVENIKQAIANKEQVILFLNRRGYSGTVICKNCGEAYKCPNCDITLTYHKTSNMLR